ncbi:ABC transporter [Caballeronia pedi]|uniref:ABC transporter n=1 Tax=Caballeronia pedi TaxID=1777141 RepID=A0A157ZRM2_9BURK|nr:ABC transporter ATP-binding protein [Caballeronia pedi]SAK48145.1 ABC transporter [Caballeronia pedi]
MLKMRSEGTGYANTLVASMGLAARPETEVRGVHIRSKGPDDFILRAVDLVHQYGPVTALDHVSLDVRRGEFLTILGESGSGKTTFLRVISGLEKVSHAAELSLDGVDVRDVPAAKRNCTTVFQSYALFPHMSVEENVCYGLKLRGVEKEEARRQANDALAMVRLSAKGTRRIGQLSGGERQRVALARAIVTRPAILLLDEPLGALDEKLRYDMQAELVEIHRALGMTFIYITHSQEEALTMSDRIVLMRRGRIEQCGTPEELFDRPSSRFAAEFMGFDNVLPCTVRSVSESGEAEVDFKGTTLRGICARESQLHKGDTALFAVRAERLTPVSRAGEPNASNVIACQPAEHVYRGKYTDQTAQTIDSTRLKIRTWDQSATPGSFNAVTCRTQDCVILPH